MKHIILVASILLAGCGGGGSSSGGFLPVVAVTPAVDNPQPSSPVISEPVANEPKTDAPVMPINPPTGVPPTTPVIEQPVTPPVVNPPIVVPPVVEPPVVNPPKVLPQGAQALNLTKVAFDFTPTASDIANTDVPAKFYTGMYWNYERPSLSLYSTAPNGDGLNIKTTGAIATVNPDTKKVGTVPLLEGGKSFYLEFEAKLDSRNESNWPALWLLSYEHANGTAFYPGDPPGFERFMELDVDEGGFKPGQGSLGSVHSWSGIWTPEKGFNNDQVNNYATVQPLDRTVFHKFGVLWNGDTAAVAWYLDDKLVFSYIGSAAPEIAKKQHFYIIMNSDSHDSKQPSYTQTIRKVTAYIK